MEEIIQAIEDFKQIRTRNSITPESLGTLLGNIVGAVSTELTTTIENITEQGNTTVEQVQQQLQTACHFRLFLSHGGDGRVNLLSHRL